MPGRIGGNMKGFLKQSFLVPGITFLIFICSCEKESTVIPVDESIPLEALSAPEYVELSGMRIYLETYLWRDFMPISPPDGRAMIAALYVVEADEKDIPQDLDIDHLWVINGSEVWSTGTFDDYRPTHPPYKIQRIARDGPKWEPGIEVDVIVRIVSDDNICFYLKAKDQAIYRTD
jgi:hypothetical protein